MIPLIQHLRRQLKRYFAVRHAQPVVSSAGAIFRRQRLRRADLRDEQHCNHQ